MKRILKNLIIFILVYSYLYLTGAIPFIIDINEIKIWSAQSFIIFPFIGIVFGSFIGVIIYFLILIIKWIFFDNYKTY